MDRRRGLIDSNVLIAAATSEHVHRYPSREFLGGIGETTFTTALHCLSECYSGLTRGRRGGGSELTPKQASAIVGSFCDQLEPLELTQAQHLNALHRFAALGGTGPRIYDYLIGQVAVVHAIPLLVTWNVRHFQPLFPTLRVATPETLLQES